METKKFNSDNENVIITNTSINMKELRRAGYNFGYGITQGIFMAIVSINIARGALKAIKNIAEKKTGFKIEVEPDEEKAAAEEFGRETSEE